MDPRNDYYHVLQVDKHSNSLELKQSYRRLALIYHPDKNPNDPNAAKRFQELSEAYEVLSNASLRKIYDEQGCSGIKNSESLIDPRKVFARVFGGSSFDSWVGKISLIENAIAQLELEQRKKDELDAQLDRLDHHAPNASKLIEGAQTMGQRNRARKGSHSKVHENWKQQEKQRIEKASQRSHAEAMKSFEEARFSDRAQRVKELQDLLKKRIAKLPESASQEEVEIFVQDLVAERETLKLESFGIPILHTIATVYRSCVDAYFGSQGWFGIPSAYYFGKGVTENITDLMQSYGAVKEAKIVLEWSNKDGERSDSHTEGRRHGDAEHPDVEALVAGKVLNMAWSMSKMEIKAVLKDVATEILYDGSARSGECDFRAHTLRRIAGIFEKVSKEDGDDIDEEFEMLVHKAAKVKLGEHIAEFKSQ